MLKVKLGRRALPTSPVYWEVFEYMPGEGYSFLGHVRANTQANAAILAGVKFPEANGILLQREYLPTRA